jgi:hypothetical protein
MPYDADTGDRSRLSLGFDPSELDRTDRILLGACAGIWLVALGAGVAAVVALVDLGRGHAESAGESGTPWLLYAVIAVSALVIAGAVPLLLQARRAALAEPEPPARAGVRPSVGRAQPTVPGVEAPTEKLRVPPGGTAGVAPRSGYPSRTPIPTGKPTDVAAVDQLWLRFAVVIACAIGIATVAIGVATYLMAVGSNAAAWVFLVLTGLVTLAMPAVPWFYLRELRDLLGRPSA